jgi:hypothetical protein
MRPSHLISFSILLSPLLALSSASAQTPQQSFGVAGMGDLSGKTILQKSPPIPIGCPVSLRARHGSAATMMQADQSRPQGQAQRLHLTLVDPNNRQIVSARVRVHGLSGKPRSTQALAGVIQPDSVRTLAVRFSATQSTGAQGKAAEAELWVSGMTAVLNIDLASLTYADGSTRTFSAQDNCRVTPDLLMLLSTR